MSAKSKLLVKTISLWDHRCAFYIRGQKYPWIIRETLGQLEQAVREVHKRLGADAGFTMEEFVTAKRDFVRRQNAVIMALYPGGG